MKVLPLAIPRDEPMDCKRMPQIMNPGLAHTGVSACDAGMLAEPVKAQIYCPHFHGVIPFCVEHA